LFGSPRKPFIRGEAVGPLVQTIVVHIFFVICAPLLVARELGRPILALAEYHPVTGVKVLTFSRDVNLVSTRVFYSSGFRCTIVGVDPPSQ